VALPPEKWGELIDKPAAAFLDPEGAQPVPHAFSCGGIEVTLLHKLFEACFQPARIGLEKAPEITGGHILQEPFPPQPEHQLQDLIPPVDTLTARVLIDIEPILACHGSLQGLQGLLHRTPHFCRPEGFVQA
jgi:hypothetical protein